MISEARKAIQKKYRDANKEKISTYQREYRQANPEKRRESTRKYYAANSEARRAHNRAVYAANPEKYRLPHKAWQERNPQYHHKRRYGLTNYDEMVAERNGKCDICSAAPAKLWVDHSHIDGRVRGLLCASCNRSIAIFDSPLFDRAKLYARGW